jgi:Uma2 family endonuclease
MAQVIELEQSTWTAADLLSRFGAMPLWRIRFDPPPGTATEADVVEIHDRTNRLCELVDGVLVEKTVGTFESHLGTRIARLLGNFVDANQLGTVLGGDGFMRLASGLVRIPDAAFISWKSWSIEEVRRQAIADLSPDLVVEVISRSNTPEEMTRKLHEYFEAGARLVWYIYPDEQTVHVFTGVDDSQILAASDTLDGGAVLPGFSVKLAGFFAEPQPPA